MSTIKEVHFEIFMRIVFKLDEVWVFDDKIGAIQSTVFSNWFITFRTRLKIQWFERS